ncbi:hypothetical protein FRC03_000018 [Tulasnella sp. 419]|nr:hypothetical protein FRC03_000018 [Tulasnella sp. 419]
MSLSAHAESLKQLASTIPDSDEKWVEVQTDARAIADGLRTRNGPVDNHTELGQSSLPVALTALLQASVRERQTSRAGTPSAAAFELLRLGANLCMDHDANRQRLLDAGYISVVSNILGSCWTHLPENSGTSTYSLLDLKVFKTAVGVLLNASVGYEPVQKTLLAAGTPLTILRVSSSLYPPGEWARALSSDVAGASGSQEKLDEWKWRSGLSSWSWRAIDILTDSGEEEETTTAPKEPIFGPDAIPSLITSLQGFLAPSKSNISPFVSPADIQVFIQADLDSLEQVSMLFESLSLDSESIRKVIAAPDPSSTPLQALVRFVELAEPPAYWDDSRVDGKDKQKWEKSLGTCKAALIKAVVTVAGEDKNMDVLWDDKDGGGWFVKKMLAWIRTHPKAIGVDYARDDLAICATLALGNLARKDSRCISLINPPFSIVYDLLPLLSPQADLKMKHGAIGLLKNLAQPAVNKGPLGDSGIIEKIIASKVWEKSADMAEVVQISAIGVAKHLCNGNLDNALRLVLSPADPATTPTGTQEIETGLDQILDLIKRSDSIALQSEATRVLVNVIKSLWQPNRSATGDSMRSNLDVIRSPIGPVSPVDPQHHQRRREAMEKVTDLDSTEPLAEMVGRSAKYPILLNEGVMALTLLSHTPTGAHCALQALTTPLPFNLSPSGVPSPPAANTSATSTPVDMLTIILRNPDKNFPMELRANVCVLLNGVVRSGKAHVKLVEDIKKKTMSALKALTEPANVGKGGEAETNGSNPQKILRSTAQKTLDTWDAITAPSS